MPKCPHCGFEAMNQRVIDMHIQEKHSQGKAETETKAEGKAKSKANQKKKEEVGDQRDWRKVLTKNYCYMLCHNKRCKVTLQNDETLEGTVHSKDPYFILLDTDERRLVVSKGYVAFIEPIG